MHRNAVNLYDFFLHITAFTTASLSECLSQRISLYSPGVSIVSLIQLVFSHYRPFNMT